MSSFHSSDQLQLAEQQIEILQLLYLLAQEVDVLGRTLGTYHKQNRTTHKNLTT